MLSKNGGLHLPVLPEEDVITLVVESHHSASLELGVVVEETGKQSSNAMSQLCREVVEYDFRALGPEVLPLAPHCTGRLD